jgi:DNA helicase-2/ATP-dependent DNA helicase PcrA
LPWLLGENMNLNAAGDRDRACLHKTFVAMTRPSHLICLAIPQSALGDNVLFFARVATMRDRGWHLADVVDGALSWNT